MRAAERIRRQHARKQKIRHMAKLRRKERVKKEGRKNGYHEPIGRQNNRLE